MAPDDIVDAFRSSGVADLVYTGPRAGPFPTLRQMIAAIQDTPYDFKRRSQLTEPARLPASCAPNRGGPLAPLLLMNHWIATAPLPRISDARVVNRRDVLVARARACERVRGHLPNLLAVNFYATGDLFGAVAELNRHPAH